MSLDAAVDLHAVTDFLEGNLSSFLTDLETIVNIDSGTFDPDGVNQVAGFLAARYRELDMDVETLPGGEYGDTVVVRASGEGSGRILLVGHTDTVYARGTVAERPFRVDGDRGYGPGTADMKSGDLAVLYALRALQEQGIRPFASLTVIHNSDEEIGSPSSRELIRHEAERADVVFVLEAGRENGNIVSARKGVIHFHLEVDGQAAHAGINHARGRSAALELAHVVVALERINGTIPGVTVNVGRIEAGERPNVVPAHGSAEFEVRGFDVEGMNEAVAQIDAIVSRRVVADTAARLDRGSHHHPMPKSLAGARLVSLAQDIARRIGFEIQDTATGGASDGNTAAAAGRPVLDGLGPVGGSAHSPGEYVLIPSIVPRTTLLAGLVASTGSNPSVGEG